MITKLSQRNDLWASDRIGNSYTTIGKDGCFLTAACMCLENLEWCTYSQNNKHAITHGNKKILKGSEVGGSKLNEYQVRRMRLLKKITNITNEKLGKIFNVATTAVDSIIRNERWKHITI